MDRSLLAIVILRSLGLTADLAGRSRVADYLFTLAEAAEAGQDVEAGMRAVAETLKNRHATAEDWEMLGARLAAAQADLHAPRSDDGGPT